MIIDVDVHLGHYPFRRLRNHAPETMLSLMDRSGISRAVVSFLPSLFYKDAHSGNEEFAEALQGRTDRLTGLATLDPTYAGWERDLEECVDRFELKGLRLAPNYHGYSLSDPAGRAILRAAVRHNLPVAISQRLEDRRQRHLWDAAPDLRFSEVAEAAREHPDLRLLLLNWSALSGSAIRQAGLRGRCLIDFARLSVVPQNTIPRLVDSLGVEAIAFGSHIPFNYPGPSLVKLAILELSAEEKEKIAWRNAARFFSLPFSPV